MRLLVLGGTTEASQLAKALASRPEIVAVLSLAGRTAAPAIAPIAMRTGGFGGVAGLADYVQRESVDALVDATHPFAAQISAHAIVACQLRITPLVAFSRPPWRAQPSDDWTSVADIPEAVRYLAALAPRPVFLTTGRLDLAAFKAAPQHRYLIRTIDPPEPDACPPHAQFVLGRGPFSVADELTLMRQHGHALLVTKNSGGSASIAKLEAARRLRLPVLMVERPVLPPRLVLEDLDDVLRWIDDHRGHP